ncbi:MAG: hypothetical protein U9O85_06490 [Euryarchaeota archaeon]|nr:hypothetical protein [Euryarchaeota archaeon]
MVKRVKKKKGANMNKYPAQWVDGICKALGIAVKGEKRENVFIQRDVYTKYLRYTAKMEGYT